MAFSGTQQKCKVCEKTVYPMEEVSADGCVYHKACFRCAHCKSLLKLGNYAALEGVMYCKPHFLQLFKQNGSYNKGFGDQKANAQDGGTKITKPIEASEVKTAGSFRKVFEKFQVQESEAKVTNTKSATDGEGKTIGSFRKGFEKFNIKHGGDSKPEEAPKAALTAKPSSKFASHFSGTTDKCVTCSKTVYPLEKTSVEGLSYHKNCFKCVYGGCVITPSNYAALEGKVYCKHHFSQLFKEKGGNYNHINSKTSPLKGVAENVKA